MSKPLRFPALAPTLFLLSACTPVPADGGAGPDGGVLHVVASTSVHADVAGSVGGPAVEVEALVAKTSQGPHSYEATARDKPAVSKADVVIANGGGCDPFMDALAQGLALPAGALLHAVDFHDAGTFADAHANVAHAGESRAGHGHAGGNEHLWYDVHTVGALARGLAAEYSRLRPDRAPGFEASSAAFGKRTDALAGRIQGLRKAAEGREFATTEPLASSLLTDAGLADGTPAGVSAAMEAGEDVSPLLLTELGDALGAHRYAVLAVNTQTSGPQAQKDQAQARAAGVPVLELTETLPQGQDHISWMESNVQELEVALGR